jgi:cobalt-zinc-cadmium efflux system protein
VWIVYEAIERLRDPIEVLGGPMLAVAVIGLAVNVTGFMILRRGDSQNVNMRGALLHVVGDLLGSVGAIAAALVILATGWTPIDPILSVFVTLLILRSAWSLTRQSANILMEGSPEEIDSDAITAEAAAVDGIADIHHIHIWAITGEQRMASMHLRLLDGADPAAVKAALRKRLADKLNIGHLTIEVDEADPAGKAGGIAA